MLVLSRRPEEGICISDNITVTVLDVRRGRVRLGIDAPKDVPILRAELQSLSAGDIEAINVTRNAVTDCESEGGDVPSSRAVA